ncbi:transglycosylase domain-containing protein [Pontibacillus yanchengensis]|uniref:Peptidoglycan glycosyltransferase n=1 Tax=Pontibacillus yanchengensis Y32 TaxID=1385514 RepID=A0A0A2TCS5_9BACI|nr:transglycosylase domain-containing protein [Pontibacillus yanchengensis]KGP73657.1 peptidoglycan glycosyltransferase [Pontibacillus yanchengensis Y32]
MSKNHSNGSDKSPFVKWWQDGKIQKASRITYDVLWNVVLFFLIIGVVGFFFAGGMGAGYFASLVKDEPIRAEEDMKQDIYNYEETTEIFFGDNKYLGKIRSDLYREEVQLENVSDYVRNAVIATEDEYFETHDGIVPKAILRAIYQEVTNASTKTGGSTLTQQLIKNQILTNEVSFERKAKEILLAMRLERFFEKDEILEAYLNVVPFGRNASGRNIAGIETAAQGIFGVSADELNLAQSAFIAGLPQSPYLYTPFLNNGQVKSEENIAPAMDRMQTVLTRMHEAGMISDQELETARNYNIAADFAEPEASPIQEYPYLTIEIEKRAKKILAKELAKQDGYNEEDLENNEALQEQYSILADRNLRGNGYKIHTTIDQEIYDKMQEVKDKYNQYGPEKKETVVIDGEEKTIQEPVQVGGLLMENSTGKILSFIGGRDYEQNQVNHATDSQRSNGSTMKPILVYAPAIELGEAQPGSVVADIDTSFQAGTKTWSPGNYTGRYHGLTSVRYALAKSFNVPAARTYADIVNQNPVSFLDKMGFTTLTEGDRTNLSMALGAVTNGVTVEENTNAYATFGNMGQFVDAYMIDRIENKDGEMLYEHKSEKTKVFSEQTSYLTIDMMRDVLDYGTARYANSRLKYPGVDWAGKTGTSQNFRDTWFVATNPNVTMGMWMGYDTPKSIKCYGCNLSYSNRNINLWSQVVNAASDIRPELMVPEESFKNPGGIVTANYCATSGLAPSELCSEFGLVKSDIYASGQVPSKRDDSLIQTRSVTVNGNTYVADEATPNEFTNSGIYFNPDWIERNGYDKLDDFSQLIPNNQRWANVSVPASNKLPNDGQAPAAPASVNASGGAVTWSPSASNDVVGYRVYRAPSPGAAFQLTGSSVDTSLGSRGRGVYIVKAVDYYGRVSGASPSAQYGDFTPDPPPETDNDNNSGNSGNSGNNNNSGDSGDSGNSGNSDGDTGGTGDSGNSGDSGNDGGDTGNSGNSGGNTGNSGDSSGDSGGSSNSSGGDSSDSGGNSGNSENSGDSNSQ